MLAYALILILLLPMAFLFSTIEILFSPEELNEMGIGFEGRQVEEIG